MKLDGPVKLLSSISMYANSAEEFVVGDKTYTSLPSALIEQIRSIADKVHAQTSGNHPIEGAVVIASRSTLTVGDVAVAIHIGFDGGPFDTAFPTGIGRQQSDSCRNPKHL